MDYDLDYLLQAVESTGKHDCAPRFESLAPTLSAKDAEKGGAPQVGGTETGWAGP